MSKWKRMCCWCDEGDGGDEWGDSSESTMHFIAFIDRFRSSMPCLPLFLWSQYIPLHSHCQRTVSARIRRQPYRYLSYPPSSQPISRRQNIQGSVMLKQENSQSGCRGWSSIGHIWHIFIYAVSVDTLLCCTAVCSHSPILWIGSDILSVRQGKSKKEGIRIRRHEPKPVRGAKELLLYPEALLCRRIAPVVCCSFGFGAAVSTNQGPLVMLAIGPWKVKW